MDTKLSGGSVLTQQSSADLQAALTETGGRPRSESADALAVGEVVGRYQVRRLIGEGGMGRVYLARDTTLGRSVALKIVRHDLFGPSAGARFVDEARTIAALNHPHVVQLYDVGEHRGALYLALEYVEGETLRQRAQRGRLSIDEALRIARAIADALAHAHGAGVYHCDLKPGNVILGRDGRLRVVDFGLARTAAAPGQGALEGTPDYMAPEQWARATPTDRVDVWALGVVMAQLLTGAHPFDGNPGRRQDVVLDPAVAPRPVEREGLAPAIARLISRSLERDPAARPAAAEWHATLDQVLEGRAPTAHEEAPFRGLAAFDERHARLFFGREQDIEAFLERLRAQPVLPIIGPSGAGKSSFLHAGVIPRLRARERVTVIAFRPGRDPVEALARSVLAAALGPDAPARPATSAREAAAFAEELRRTPTLIAARLATVAAASDASVLVAIDQFEELFTHGAPEAEVRLFLALVFACADDPRDPVRVVFTLRDDFLGRVEGVRSLFIMRRLGDDDLRRAIESPVQRCGYRFDDLSLVDAMLAEIGSGQADALPLLQFACRALWDGRDPDRRLLLRSTYDHIGGVAGALARHADGVLASLSPVDRRLARQLLLRLAVGTTRRTVERSALLAGLPAAAEGALDRLLAARLITQRTAPDGAGVLLDIAHESLLHAWSQLAEWLDESRDERRLLAELEGAALQWERRSHPPEATWPADDLLATRRQLAKLGLELPPRLEAFLAAGERRQRELRRRTQLRFASVAALGGVAIALTTGFTTRYRLAGSNMGQVDLELAPFDWVDGAPKPVDAAALPKLSWQLYGPLPGNEHREGAPLPPELVRSEPRASSPLRIDRVEAPGGAAFLRIDGRGRPGESCAPSWVRLQNLPGYRSRDAAPPQWRIEVPTCQASAHDTITIEAGPFIYGGRGDPPTKFDDYVEPERTVDLPAYAIDRTEVSNAQFAPFARIAGVTGYPAPSYPAGDLYVHDGDPDRPVTSIDAFEAEAFCRYMGRRLPSDYEWTKSARGGLIVNGAPNAFPRRLFPWGTRDDDSCVNTREGAEDMRWLASVDAFACGASPYGVLNLVGNVSEWISREGQVDRDQNPLHVTRGGDIMSTHALDHTTTVFKNSRNPRHFFLSIGVRCTSAPKAAPKR